MNTPVEEQGNISVTKRMTIRKRVSSACISCKKGKMRCEDQRPCKTCVRYGKERQCVASSKTVPKAKDNISRSANLEHYADSLISSQRATGFQNSNFALSWSDTHYNQWYPLPQQGLVSTGDMEHNLLHARSSQALPSYSSNAMAPLPLSRHLASFAPQRQPLPAAAELVLLEQLIAHQRQEIIAAISNMAPRCPERPVSQQPPTPGPLPSLAALRVAADASGDTNYPPSLAPLQLPLAMLATGFRS